MLKDKAYKYFIETDLNCSESVLMAVSEEYGLDLKPEDYRLVSAFGRGMGCGMLCGALAGCMAAIGKMTVTGRAHTTEGFNDLCAGLYQAFENRLGSTVCAELKPIYRSDTLRCLKLVEITLDLFEEYAKENGFVPQKGQTE